MKKKSKVVVGMIGGLIVGSITVIAVIFVFIMIFFFGGPPKVTKDVARYEETLQKYMTLEHGSVKTGFFTFPETVPASAFEQGGQPEFYFWYQDTWDEPTCETYLKCAYSEADYNSEISRLKNISKDYEGQHHEVIYDDSDRFAHPVYMVIDHSDMSYEYAMDLGDNTIAYIYTAFKTNRSDLKKIPKEYLPKDYEESLEVEKGTAFADGNYNIYEFPANIPGVEAVTYDFSK